MKGRAKREGFARDVERAREEGTGSPPAAFVAGGKEIVPVLLALLPFGLAFGATTTGNGLSAVEALGMSVFVFAGAVQLTAVPLLWAGATWAAYERVSGIRKDTQIEGGVPFRPRI